MEALVNGRVLTAEGFRERQTVVIEDGRIHLVVNDADCTSADVKRQDLDGQLLLPGFIDVQVNGGNGVLFNNAPNVDAIREIGVAHRKYGTTGFLPTLISDDLSVVKKAIAATREAMTDGVPGVLGIHLEGPFLNEAKKGAHDASKFRILDDSAVSLLSSLGVGKTLVTIAPEMTSPEMIGRLLSAGVIVSAGHTNANYEQMRAALDAGVTGFTHLFNAMSPFGSREPGVVGAALQDQHSWCGIIVDGHHVHEASLHVALAAKRSDRFVLVTDAMPSVGMTDKRFELDGRKITVSGGKCLAPDGTLAGSDLDMASAIRNATTMLGCDLEEAVRMASQYPAEFLGLDAELGQIKPGYRANLVLADDDMNVIDTWIDGVGG